VVDAARECSLLSWGLELSAHVEWRIALADLVGFDNATELAILRCPGCCDFLVFGAEVRPRLALDYRCLGYHVYHAGNCKSPPEAWDALLLLKSKVNCKAESEDPVAQERDYARFKLPTQTSYCAAVDSMDRVKEDVNVKDGETIVHDLDDLLVLREHSRDAF